MFRVNVLLQYWLETDILIYEAIGSALSELVCTLEQQMWDLAESFYL